MVRTVDRDDATVMALLREAVTVSGLSQAAFGRALGTSASRLSTYLTGTTRPSAHFLVRAQRQGAALAAAAERGLMSAPTTAALMREHLMRGDEPWAWRMLLQGRDHLARALAEDDQQLIDSWEAEPTSVGEAGWDAFLAALAEHEFDLAGKEAPDWTRPERLTEPWQPEHPFLSRERVDIQTPDWLRIRNIYVPARDLVTA